MIDYFKIFFCITFFFYSVNIAHQYHAGVVTPQSATVGLQARVECGIGRELLIEKPGIGGRVVVEQRVANATKKETECVNVFPLSFSFCFSFFLTLLMHLRR